MGNVREMSIQNTMSRSRSTETVKRLLETRVVLNEPRYNSSVNYSSKFGKYLTLATVAGNMMQIIRNARLLWAEWKRYKKIIHRKSTSKIRR